MASLHLKVNILVAQSQLHTHAKTVKPIQKLIELTLQLKQCEVSGGLSVFFLFKLPRK